MEALGTLNAFEAEQAVIKTKVGEFLSAEAKLRRLAVHPSVSIQARANGLLVKQKQIETELGPAQANVAKFQSGAWTFGDMYQVSNAAWSLLAHLKDVEKLESEAFKTGVAIPATARALPYATVGIVGLGLLWVLSR